jgi:hypothetical protein
MSDHQSPLQSKGRTYHEKWRQCRNFDGRLKKAWTNEYAAYDKAPKDHAIYQCTVCNQWHSAKRKGPYEWD